MMNPQDLEMTYQEYIQDLSKHAPDGIFDVDLSLLYELDLLNAQEEEEEDSALTQSFYVLESSDKLTLYNQKFVVWIVPKMVEETPKTFTLIALNENEKPHLEMVFATSGVYNHSNLVLRILERFLAQIEETEKEIVKLEEN